MNRRLYNVLFLSILFQCYECTLLSRIKDDKESSVMIEHNFLRIHGVESKNDIKEIDTGSRKIQSADLMEDIISITFSVQLLESANSTMESDNLRIGQGKTSLFYTLLTKKDSFLYMGIISLLAFSLLNLFLTDSNIRNTHTKFLLSK